MDELRTRVRDALLSTIDSEGEALAWSAHFWTREQAAEFLADAAIREVLKTPIRELTGMQIALSEKPPPP